MLSVPWFSPAVRVSRKLACPAVRWSPAVASRRRLGVSVVVLASMLAGSELPASFQDERRTEQGRPGADGAPGQPPEKKVERAPGEWIQDLESGDSQRVDAAMRALEALGPRASVVVPDLIRILELDQPETRRHVLSVLRSIGPGARDSIPAVRKKLFHDDFHVQYWSCRVLGAIGDDAKVAADDLCQLLGRDYAASTRRNAAIALGRIGPGVGKNCVESLLDSLRDRNHPVRVEVAHALGLLGELAQPAVPELRAALLDQTRGLRVPAALALWRITRMPDTLLPVLVEELASGDQPWEAAAAFAEFGSQAAPVVPRLIVLLKAENPEVRLGALEALGNIGPAARTAADEVTRLLQDADPDVVNVARDTLKKLAEPPAHPAPTPEAKPHKTPAGK